MHHSELETQVSKATVYTDRAMITRNVSTSLHTGPQTISLTGLPAQFAHDSLRIAGSGNATVTILDFKLRQRTYSEVPEDRVRELMEQKRALEHKQEALNAEQEVIRQQKEFLRSIGVATTENISKELNVQRPTVGDYKEVLDFMGKETRSLDAQYQGIARGLEEVAREINSIVVELKGYTNLTSKTRHYAEVEIEVAEAGDFTFEMSYLVHNANWQPMYDARVRSSDKQVSLRYFGLVSQRTGESWKQVEVQLSTARPHLSGDPPTIHPWYVGVYQERPAMMRSRAQADAFGGGGFDDDEMAAEEALAVPVAPPAAKAKKMVRREAAVVQPTEGASAVFSTQGKSDVPGDGSTGKLLILEREFPNTFRYLTVPKLAEHVYLTAEVENNTEYPLLPGKINIFLDGNFVGNASLPRLVTPEETFDLNLGVDESIRVRHKLLRKKGDEKGLFTKAKVLHYAYRITLENLRSTAEEVTVQDQLPVSQNEKIKVEVEKIHPAENPDKDTDKLPHGTVEWKLEAAGKSETKIELAFSVNYPKDLSVTGL